MKKLKLFTLLAAMFLPLVTQAQSNTLTTCRGTASNSYVPFQGYNADHAQTNQFIYPADSLTAMNSQSIQRMVFYIDASGSNGTYTAASRLGTWTVSLGETEATSLSGVDNATTMTQVYQGYLDCSTGTMTLEFDGGYSYNGGNLLVQFVKPTDVSGEWNTWYFLGIDATGASYTYNSQRNFLPQVQFTYGAAPTCFRLQDLTAGNVLSDGATLAWSDPLNSGASYTVYNMADTSVVASGLTDTTYDLTGLSANTNYTFGVAAHCSAADSSSFVTVGIRTACVMLTDSDFPYTENFNTWTTGSTYFDPCWTRMGYYSTYLPYAYATTGPNGTDDTVLIGYAGNNSAPMFAVMPAMEDVSGKMVSFFAKGGTANYATIQVGYMTNPADTTTFHAVSTTGLMPTTWGYYEAVLPTDEMEDVHYIAFRMHNTPYSGYYVYIDDITVGDAPACQRPASLAVRNISSASAELWINDSTENDNYTVKVINGTDTATIAATDTVVTLPNLTANTPYQVVVVSNCSDGTTTVPIRTSFRTSCVEIEHDALPWTAHFDSLATGTVTADNLGCWTVTSTSTSYPAISSAQSHSVSNSLQLYGTTVQTIAMPTFYNDLSTLQLSFWHMAYANYSGTVTAWVEVGVMSNPSDPTTFVPVQVCHPDSAGWTPYEVTFAGFTTGNIAFRYAGTSTYNSIYLDDITVQDVPSCVRPSSVAVSNLTSTGVTLTISDANNAGSYSVAIVGGDSTMTYSNTLDLDTLRANTTYTVSVRTLCDNGTLTEATLASFTTACAAEEIPYSTDFDSLATDVAPNCWTPISGNVNVVANTSSYTTNSHSGLNYLRFSGSTRNMIALPLMEEEISGLQVRFFTRSESNSNSSCGKFQVGYLTNVADTSTFTAVSTWNYNEFTGYEEKEVSMAGAPEGARIAFLQKDCSASWYWFVDDLVVEPIPMCARPVSVSVSGITVDGATLNVNDPAEAYSYRYYLAMNDSIVDSNDFYDLTYTFTTLSANTVYSVSVATVCGSDVTNTVSTSFRTGCTAIATDDLPYTESFEDYPAAAGIIPCWSYLGTDATKMSVVAANAHSGSKSYRFGGTAVTPHIAILPEFEDGISTLMLGFWLKSESSASSGTLAVGYVYDDTTFVQKVVYNAADYLTMDYAEVTFADAPDGARIAIAQQQTTSTGYWWWIDDLTVGVATSCERPQGVSVANIGTTTADIVVLDSNEVNSYKVVIVNGTDTVVNVPATDTLYQATGLTPGTHYTVYVSAVCSDGNVTTAVSTSFFTECEDISVLPWTESFETWATGTAGFNPCWNRIYQSGSYTSTNNHPYVMAGGYDSTANAMRFYSMYSDDGYSYSSPYYYSVAFLPVFQAPVNTLSMSFWYKVSGTYDADYTELVVGVSSSTTDTSTFTRLATFVPVDAQWHEYDLDFSAYTGTGNRITIMQRNIDGDEEYDYDYDDYYTYSSAYGYLDSITVSALGNCARPATLVVSGVDTTHATLTWTDVNGTGDYVVTCSNGDSVTVSNALTYTFSNLVSNTNYAVSVRRICAGQLTNARTITFTTLSTPVTVLPYSTGFEAGDDLQWEFAQGNANRWYIDTAAAATGTRGLYISNDNGVTNDYNVNAQAVSYAFRTFELEAGEYAVSFDWRAAGESNWDFLRVFAMPDSIQPVAGVFIATPITTGVPAGWQAVVPGKLNQSSTYTQAEGTFTVANGGRYKLVFMWRNDNSTGSAPAAAVDNVHVEALSCSAPTSLVFDTVTENSITLSWTATGSESTWLVSVDGGTWQSTNTTSYTATSLAAATEHTFAVRALCGVGDTSFALSGSVRTECGIIRDAQLPWEENFDAISTMLDLECWNRYTGLYTAAGVTLTDGSAWTNTTTAMSGSKHVVLNIYGTNIKAWLVSPTINTVASTVLTFDYALTRYNSTDSISQAGNDDRFIVLVTTDNGTTWTPVATWDSVGNAYASISPNATTATVSLAAYAGQNIRIAFYGESTVTGGDNNLHIDNVAVRIDTTAPQPTTYTVTLATANATMGNVTPAGATVVAENASFTARASANSGYHFTNWTSNGNVVSTDNPYTFTVTADITLTANFEADETPVACQAPSNVSASNITANSATISWIENGTATSWVIDYNGQTVNATTNPYTLTGLTANTSYSVAVKAICGDNEESDFSEPYSFTTANVSIDDVENAAISLYPNPASSTVTLKGIEGMATVTLVDMNGRAAGKWTVANGELTIDLTSFAQGAYFVRIVGEQVNAIRKLIVR